jgi:uncharacterized protein YecE (DUF72 family)
MRNLHLGTIGWSYSFWKGKFYPNKVASEDFLAYYATRFDTVEVDSTFYRIPTVQAVTKWENQTPGNFLFSFKFPRVITHIKMLKDCDRETRLFLDRTELLSGKLGALLLQFPATFGVDRFSDLADFLQKLPKNRRYVVEVRNEQWLNSDFYSLLRANGVGLVWVDSPNMPQSDVVTSDFLYLRLEGDRGRVKGTLGVIEADKAEGLKMWAEKIKHFLNENREIYGYFGKYYSGFPPSDVNSLLKLLS